MIDKSKSDLIKKLAAVQAQPAALTEDLVAFKSLVENSNDAIFMVDMDVNFTYANRAAHEMFGYDYGKQEMIGIDGTIIWATDDLATLREIIIPQALEKGWHGELHQQRQDGTLFTADATMYAVRHPNGSVTDIAAIIRDISAYKAAEAKREALQHEVIAAQQQALKKLATPIIPVLQRPDGRGSIIIAPLVGNFDALRARDTMRALLAGIRTYRAKIIILDITGVPLVDTGVAAHLNKTIQAARLKGAHTIVTGISDAVAETIIDLGIDWSDIQTLNDLQSGLLAALQILGYQLSPIN